MKREEIRRTGGKKRGFDGTIDNQRWLIKESGLSWCILSLSQYWLLKEEPQGIMFSFQEEEFVETLSQENCDWRKNFCGISRKF